MAFLNEVEHWIPEGIERVYAIADHLSSHRTTDGRLFMLAHPRWEMVFQPKYAAYLNLIEPWWKILRSLALAGPRFERWEDVAHAVALSRRPWPAGFSPACRASSASAAGGHVGQAPQGRTGGVRGQAGPTR